MTNRGRGCGRALLILLAFTSLLVRPPAAHAQPAGGPAASDLPSFDRLGNGWNTLVPGPPTVCAHGGEYSFWVRPADPSRIMIYFHGGGACWDAESCAKGSDLYTDSIRPQSHPSRFGGILDADHPENPFAGHTMISVPGCTGDVHLGDNDAAYTLMDETGGNRQFTIRHRGQTNANTVMAWIHANLPDPREIFVSGSSAGALAVPFYASRLARHYPGARVVGLADDAGSYGSGSMAQVDPARHGLPDALRRHAGWEGIGERLQAEQLTITAARSAANLRMFHVDHAYDNAQAFWLERGGTADPDVLELIRRNRRAIRSEVPEFRAYTVGGRMHTIVRNPAFYRYHVGGFRLRDWVAAIAAGDTVADVECSECTAPELVFDQDDERIIEHALVLLRSDGAWQRHEPGGACPQDTDRYTLRCAIIAATRHVSGRPAGEHAAIIAVLYAAAERLPHPDGDWAPLTDFNNDAATTPAAVRALLDDVLARMRAERQRQESASAFVDLPHAGHPRISPGSR